jgi:hypothetical protein
MAIVFDCPHCKTNYRLKDDLAGKTATCKNPNCRKVITIPPPTAASAAKNVDVDALAAAAFSDEVVQGPAVVEEMIKVTCSGCDHVWSVEASKEGKNVLCPECRRPNRVPMRKKEEKVDWRTGADGKPTLAKRETGLDREGAFASTNVGSIGQQTAAKIVKDRDAEEEPGEKRKRWTKRIVIGMVLIAGLSASGYFLMKQKRERGEETRMEEAVKEYRGKDGKERVSGLNYALIERASGEHRIRAASNKKDCDDALSDLKKARNAAKPTVGSPAATVDQNAVLADIAASMVELSGATDQVAKDERFGNDIVTKEVRETLQEISDPIVQADALREVTRKLALKGYAATAIELAVGLQKVDMRGHVGLELLRLDREKYRGDVEKMLSAIPPAAKDEPLTIQTLRLLFPKPAKKGEEPLPPTSTAAAEKAALSGDVAGAKVAANGNRNPPTRVQAFLAAARALSDSNTSEAGNLAEQAALAFLSDPAMAISPWMPVQICRILGKAGKFDKAEEVISKMPGNMAQSWARLEVFRGKLSQLAATKGKAEGSLLTPVGDPKTVPAAAKAHEELARHNAFYGHDYEAVIKTWEKGTVKPFGMAGTVLGKQDKK